MDDPKKLAGLALCPVTVFVLTKENVKRNRQIVLRMYLN